MKRLAVARFAVAFLLSLALLVSAAAQKVSANGATLTAAAAGNPIPLLDEAMDAGDENLPAPGLLYLDPTIFCPVLFAPAATCSVAQTRGAAKRDLQIYRLKRVLLI